MMGNPLSTRQLRVTHHIWYCCTMLPSWLIVILTVVATHRVTRLITRDQVPVIAVPREAFAQRWATYAEAKTYDEKHTSLNGKKTNIVMRSLAYLWECDWCMSVWVGAATSLGTYHWMTERWWQWVLVAATASSVTGLIAQREPE